jgi:hypothetical protein
MFTLSETDRQKETATETLTTTETIDKAAKPQLLELQHQQRQIFYLKWFYLYATERKKKITIS